MTIKGLLFTFGDVLGELRGYRVLVSFQRPMQFESAAAVPVELTRTAATIEHPIDTPGVIAQVPGTPVLSITNISPLAPGTVGVPYSIGLTVTGGAPPYNWLTNEALPAGLTLGTRGTLGGTPTVGGNFKVTLSVADAAGSIVKKSFSLLVNPVRVIESLTTARLDVPVAGNGSFTVQLPETGQIRSAVTFRVLAAAGEVVATAEKKREELSAEIRIEIPPPSTAIHWEPADPSAGKRLKVAGYIVDQRGRKKLASIQILIQVRQIQDGPWETIALVKTDRNGFFSSQVPNRRFAEAQAVLGLEGSKSIMIPIADGHFTSPLILPVEDFTPPPEGEHDCGCASDVANPVDMDDLTNAPGSFSGDVGGGRCVEFTIPNRSIEEFNYFLAVRITEPQIKGMNVEFPNSVEQLNAAIAAEQHAVDTLNGVEKKLLTDLAEGRQVDVKELSLVRKNIAASEQKITDMGKFRSVLLNSPQSLITRGILSSDNSLDWDSDPTVFQATTVSLGHLLQLKQVWCSDGYSLGDLLYSLPLAPCQKKQIAIIDWERRETAKRSEDLAVAESLQSSLVHNRDLTEVVSAVVRERQTGFSAAVSTGVSAGFGAMLKGGFLGVAGGLGLGASFANQKSQKDVASSSLQQLRDSTLQAASSLRTERSTVIQTVAQTESSRVQTEVVANHNHCHAITIQYFQVLRHLKLTHELAGVQECLFIPLLLTPFDARKVLRWRGSIQPVLLDKSLAPDLDAVQRQESGLSLEVLTGSEDKIATIIGEMRLQINVSRPGDNPDGTISTDAWKPLAPFLTGDAQTIWNNVIQPVQGDGSQFRPWDQTIEQSRNIRRDAAFKGIANTIAAKVANFVRVGLYGSSGHRRVDIVFPQPWVDYSIRPFKNNLQLSEPRGSVEKIAIEFEGLPTLVQATVAAVKIVAKSSSGAVLFSLSENAGRSVTEGSVLADHHQGTLYDVPSSGASSSQAVIPPQLADLHASERLLGHLNANLEYYHRALWLNMDPDRRFLLLDGFLAPNGRSLATVVENRVIGIAGNSIIMPVAPGFELDPLASQPLSPEKLLGIYHPVHAQPPIRVSFPTGGVFAESVMGSCNSCETKDDTKFWCPEECPCGDEPTAINPVTVPTPQASTPNLTAKDLPTSIINLQTAPSAPDPTGLASALQLLGTKDLFRDVTGLAKNQENALKSFSESLATAEKFGLKAGEIFKMDMAQRNGAKTVQSIEDARDRGLLTDDQARGLTNTLFKSMSGQASEPPTAKEKVKAVEDAANSGLINQDQLKEFVRRILGALIGQTGHEESITQIPAIASLLTEDPNRVTSVSFQSGTESLTVDRQPDDPSKAVLKFHQHVPAVRETDACGVAANPIKRSSPEFDLLVKNENEEIVFKDEEGTGADRMMTPELKTKLDILADLIQLEWPGKKLRVTEAWDENAEHGPGALHYEGRAADITISDMDSKKLGRLAQLAVDAGFGWVYYEDTRHVHVSVPKP